MPACGRVAVLGFCRKNPRTSRVFRWFAVAGRPPLINNARIGISDTVCFLTVHTGTDAFFKVEFESNGENVHVRRSTSDKEDFKTVVLHCKNLFLPTTAAILSLLISPTTILDSLEWELSHKKVYIEVNYQLMYHLNGGTLRMKKLVFNRDAKKDFIKIITGMCSKEYLKDVEKSEVMRKTVDLPSEFSKILDEIRKEEFVREAGVMKDFTKIINYKETAGNKILTPSSIKRMVQEIRTGIGKSEPGVGRPRDDKEYCVIIDLRLIKIIHIFAGISQDLPVSELHPTLLNDHKPLMVSLWRIHYVSRALILIQKPKLTPQLVTTMCSELTRACIERNWIREGDKMDPKFLENIQEKSKEN